MLDETIEMKETGLGKYCSMLAKNTDFKVEKS